MGVPGVARPPAQLSGTRDRARVTRGTAGRSRENTTRRDSGRIPAAATPRPASARRRPRGVGWTRNSAPPPRCISVSARATARACRMASLKTKSSTFISGQHRRASRSTPPRWRPRRRSVCPRSRPTSGVARGATPTGCAIISKNTTRPCGVAWPRRGSVNGRAGACPQIVPKRGGAPALPAIHVFAGSFTTTQGDPVVQPA